MSLLHRLKLALFTLAAVCFAGLGSHADVAVQALNADVSVVTGNSGAEAVQPDGKLLVAASSADANGNWLTSLQRFTPDGAADSSFDAAALQVRGLDELAALPDGQIVAVGRFGANPNANVDEDDDDAVLAPDPETVLRLNADGSADPGFQAAALPLDWVQSINILADGGALIAGYVDSTDSDGNVQNTFNLVRLTAAGQIDPAFHASFPLETWTWIETVILQPDGRIVLDAQNVGNAESSLSRLNADGSVDAAFTSGLPAGREIDALTLLADGRLLVASTTTDDEDESETITRLNADGSVDAGFNVTLPGSVDSLLALGDGSVLATGDFAGDNDNYSIRRIDSAGNVTTVFDPASTDQLQDVTGLAGGGFAATFSAAAADGSHSGLVRLFDGAATSLCEAALGEGLFGFSMLARPAGGVYVNASNFPVPPAGVTFSPPPAPGSSTVKAGPTVRIDVLRAAGYAGATRKAKFLLTRTGDVSKDLRVAYQVKGSAVGGRDYLPLRGVKIIKAGRATARIKVRPMGARYGPVRPGGASVKLVLLEKRKYSVGLPATAKVQLLNHPGVKLKP